jgi:pyruvate dehydrogenase E2 component (dihydrolipoamide acetyltransferase)
MAEIIRMPAVLAGASEAAIQTWLVQPGAAVTVEQTLAEIETDKAIVEFQAEFEGVVGRLLAAEGDSVAVGDPILVLVDAGEGDAAIDAALAESGVAAPHPQVPAAAGASTTDASAPAVAAPSPQPAPEAPAVPSSPPETTPASPSGRRLFASPLVRRLAAQNGVDLAAVAGSGPNGRVVRRDLERHLASASTGAVEPVAPTPASSASAETTRAAGTLVESAPGAGHEDVPLDRMRKAIARRLTESKSTIPHFYLVADCRVDALLALRAQVNESALRKISVNDFVVKAVAAALVEVPVANAIWNGDSIRRFSSVDISVAVATDGGLTTPVLRGVERMPLSQVNACIAELAERARSGRLKQHELEGGSFSVSNLGMYGTTEFSAILNPPQSGILAVGAARKAPIVDADGQLQVGTVMTVTLSADHRVLDGAVAAQWLAALQRRLENPLTILI